MVNNPPANNTGDLGLIPWRRKWQLTPVFFPGKPCGQRNLAGYSPWVSKESDTTKQLNNNNTRDLCVCIRFSQIWPILRHSWDSPVVQRVKGLPAIRETQVRSLGQENPLEKEMVTHSSILAWRIPWTEEPGGLQSMGSQRVRHC